MLVRFGDGLDRAGLPLPAAQVELDYRRRRQLHSGAEPDHHLYPLMALAQHHGLPTTLLDWSRRASVGAYFAAVHMADETKRKDVTHVAIWALQRPHRRSADEGLLFFEAPASTNPNLHAQDGLFTIIPPSEEDDHCIEDYLVRTRKLLAKRAETDGRARVVALPRLRRIMVPVVETKRLLRFLSYEGVTGASMFPGNDGVVRAMGERVLWDQPQRDDS
jgi:hypothetical protein